MSTKNKSGRGQCGCCGPTWDSNECYAYCNAVWSGRMFPGHETFRSRKCIYTWSFRVNQYTLNAELTPVLSGYYVWINQNSFICNKWLNTWDWEHTTPELISGGLPPEGWKYDNTNYIPPGTLPSDWVSVDITQVFQYYIQRYSYTYGPWYWDGAEWTTTIPPYEGTVYYSQTCNLQLVWSVAGEYTYQLTDFESDWETLYAKLDFDTLIARRAANADFHFAVYYYDSTGQIIEDYYYETIKEPYKSAGIVWRDKWTRKNDYSWCHDVWTFGSEGEEVANPWLYWESYYTRIVAGGAESGHIPCTTWKMSYAESESGSSGFMESGDSPGITLPHSTYLYLQSYQAPAERISGIPDFGYYYEEWNAGPIALDRLNPDGATAHARITIVPLPSATTNFALRRYSFAADNNDGINPTGCCHGFANTLDAAIQVQSIVDAFEFVRAEQCGGSEIKC